jgi:hypothetical protein
MLPQKCYALRPCSAKIVVVGGAYSDYSPADIFSRHLEPVSGLRNYEIAKLLSIFVKNIVLLHGVTIHHVHFVQIRMYIPPGRRRASMVARAADCAVYSNSTEF